ncbi:caspase family protein [Martelella endophytica]|uniref:caspase family protein n=1 Tax=Martelella endophytica TaxID=1486262 RepID=UPI00069704AE|nr:caspase family protein [Martelella endophytica]
MNIGLHSTRLIGLLIFLVSAPAAMAAERLALVIGNSSYLNASHLPNAAQDASDMSDALRGLGFEVYDGYNLTRIETLKLTAEMADRLGPDDIALFYFSGHGIQLGAENFVLPVDAGGDDEGALKRTSVSLQAVLREMELRADRTVIILDACRNNPFQAEITGRSVGSGVRGLARVDAGVGSYIAFSTQPGNVALDGSGRNSPFTDALLRHIGNANDDLHELMRKVRAEVVETTGGTQVPWENSSLIEKVFLTGETLPVTLDAPQPASLPPSVAQPADTSQFPYAVAGLDPNGDGFLSLRAGDAASAAQIARMPEGTRLAVLEQRGVWFHIRTETGLEGWAHSNWVRFTGARSAAAGDQCETLWYQRNAYFDKYGYCFSSARGKAAFSNVGCVAGVTAANAPLTTTERAEVSRLQAQEKALGCN